MIRLPVALVALAYAAPLQSQQRPAPHVIQWYEAGTAVAAILGLMLVDEPLQRFAQDVRSETTDDIAAFVRHFGQPEVWATVPTALIVGGLVTKNQAVAKVGARAGASIALAAGVEVTLKFVIGRARPDSGLGAYHFDSFSSAISMPSGHSALSWALMSSLANEVRSGWVKAGLYGLAAMTALSRVNDDRHWLSDVTAGSLIGFTSAQLVHGKWQVFGLQPPQVLVTGEGLGFVWSSQF